MDKKEIKDYLKRVDELGAKLTGEDKETYTWLIYGYNQCAKLLNEKEQQVKKQKEVIDKAIKYIKSYKTDYSPYELSDYNIRQILDILEEGKNEWDMETYKRFWKYIWNI